MRNYRYYGVLFLILFVCACSQDSGGQKVAPPPAVMHALSLGMAMQPTSALAFIAREQGYFQQHGLAVNFHEFPSGKRALKEGVLIGKVDVATSSDMPVAMAGLQGHDFKIIATTFSAGNVNRIITRKDAGISQPSELRGKRIATQKASAVHYFLHLFLLEQGLSEQDVEMHFMKAEELPKALADGRIDAFSMREPFISQAEEMLAGNVNIFSAPGIYSQVEVVAVSGEFYASNPTALTALLHALRDAECFAASHPDEAIDIVARQLAVPSAEIRALWPTLQLRVVLEQSLLLLLESEARWAMRSGLSENRVVPNYLDYIVLENLQQIDPQAVTIICSN